MHRHFFMFFYIIFTFFETRCARYFHIFLIIFIFFICLHCSHVSYYFHIFIFFEALRRARTLFSYFHIIFICSYYFHIFHMFWSITQSTHIISHCRNTFFHIFKHLGFMGPFHCINILNLNGSCTIASTRCSAQSHLEIQLSRWRWCCSAAPFLMQWAFFLWAWYHELELASTVLCLAILQERPLCCRRFCGGETHRNGSDAIASTHCSAQNRRRCNPCYPWSAGIQCP